MLIGVPDHWHAAIAIDALNAGKDVYVEKPLTLRIEEGPPIVKAARINNRICQVGMQQRSGKHYLEAKAEYIDTEKLGKITLARTWWHGNSYHLRKAPDRLAQQPSNLDWAHFLGPLKWRDWDPQQYWNWRAYLDFGGGQVTDLFTHWIDVVHMFMGAGHSDCRQWRRAAFTTIRTAAPRPTPSTCCWNTRSSSRRPSKPRWCPVSLGAGDRILRDARAGCGSTAAATSSRLWAANAQTDGGEGTTEPGPGPHPELPGLREVAQAAQWRCADRPSLGAGFAPGQHLLHAEAAHRFRPRFAKKSCRFKHGGRGSAPPTCYTESFCRVKFNQRSFMISATQMRPGMVIKYNNELYSVFSVNHRTPGNLRGFVQAKMRSLRSGSMTENRFSSEDKVEKAIMDEQEMEYLYDDGEYYYFMNTETYEQMHLMKDLLGDATQYLIPQLKVNVEFYEGKPISVELPATVDMTGGGDRARHARAPPSPT